MSRRFLYTKSRNIMKKYTQISLHIGHSSSFRLFSSNNIDAINSSYNNNTHRYRLPKPTWSLDELRILGESDHMVVDEAMIDKLAKLSCIDLEVASERVKKEDVCRGINVILNCARILKDSSKANPSLINKDDIGQSFASTVTMSALREDIAVTPDVSVKKVLLSNSSESFKDYYAVPKIRDT